MRKLTNRLFKYAALWLATLLLAGCSIGPLTVKKNRTAYNRALIQTSKEQLLENLVRLRYRDTPYFLEVSSVTASPSAGGTLGFLAQIISNSAPQAYTGSSETAYKDNPTISYAPLQGENFVKQLLAPISMESLLSMIQSGWSIERVFTLAVEKINSLENAPTASGPTPTAPPAYEDFQHSATLFRKVQSSRILELGVENVGEKQQIAMKFLSNSEEARELKSLLGVPSGKQLIAFENDFLHRKRDAFTVRTRSLLGVLFFLSQAVKVPNSHVKKGLVTVTQHPDGSEFNWDDVTGNLVKIHSQRLKPMGAAVRVRYRGWWFYIKDSDLNSKSTFMLLGQLFNLQAGQTQTVAPTLTIPIGR